MEKFVSYFDEKLHQQKLKEFPYTILMNDLEDYYQNFEDKLEEMFGYPYMNREIKSGDEIITKIGKWFLFEHDDGIVRCHFKTQEDAMMFRMMM